MREIILIGFIVMALICYFGIAYPLVKLNDKEMVKGIVSLVGMTFIVTMSIFVNFILISENENLHKKIKGKCPEYQKIEAYTLKK